MTELAARLKLPLVGGSDAHRSRDIGRVVNRLPAWVKGVPELRRAVEARQNEILYAPPKKRGQTPGPPGRPFGQG